MLSRGPGRAGVPPLSLRPRSHGHVVLESLDRRPSLPRRRRAHRVGRRGHGGGGLPRGERAGGDRGVRLHRLLLRTPRSVEPGADQRIPQGAGRGPHLRGQHHPHLEGHLALHRAALPAHDHLFAPDLRRLGEDADELRVRLDLGRRELRRRRQLRRRLRCGLREHADPEPVHGVPPAEELLPERGPAASVRQRAGPLVHLHRPPAAEGLPSGPLRLGRDRGLDTLVLPSRPAAQGRRLPALREQRRATRRRRALRAGLRDGPGHRPLDRLLRPLRHGPRQR